MLEEQTCKVKKIRNPTGFLIFLSPLRDVRPPHGSSGEGARPSHA
jgi:hypothetical protein